MIKFERRIVKLWERGKIRVPVHFSGGNEDELIKIFKHIKKKDYVFSTHRNHYHYLLKRGTRASGLLAEIVGDSSKGICKGQSGSMHTIDVKNRFYSSGIVAGCVAIAVGVATANKYKSSPNQVYCFVGDGATDEGWFWEAVRYAHGHELPVKFVVEDNNRSVCTEKVARWGKRDCLRCGLTPYLDNVIYYKYTPKYPHVGSGKVVEW